MLIEIRDGKRSTYVRADQIAAVHMPEARGERAVVQMVNGVGHDCTHPGAVRDAWQAFLRTLPPSHPQDTSLFGRIFGPSGG